jgi:hypothetical protein
VRMTISLDEDTAERLRELAHRRGASLEETVDQVIRTGLAAELAQRVPYRVPARDMHLRKGINLTHALRLADALEDEEALRNLELRE